MYQTARKLHLWIGLILSIFILVEAVTGLILAEPWLVGQASSQMQPPGIQQDEQRDNVKQLPPREGVRSAPSGMVGFSKGLHQGKVGSTDFKWIIGLTAIGLVILTLTGLYIAIPILRVKNGEEKNA